MAVSTTTRVSELARELGIDARELIQKASDNGMLLTTFSRLDEGQVKKVRELFVPRRRRAAADGPRTESKRRTETGRRTVVRRRVRAGDDNASAASEAPAEAAPTTTVRRRRSASSTTQPAASAEAPAPTEQPVEAPEAPAPAAPPPVRRPRIDVPSPAARADTLADVTGGTRVERGPTIRRARVEDLAMPDSLQPRPMHQAPAERAAGMPRARPSLPRPGDAAIKSPAEALAQHEPQAAGDVVDKSISEEGDVPGQLEDFGQAIADTKEALPSERRVPRLVRTKMPEYLVNIPKPEVQQSVIEQNRQDAIERSSVGRRGPAGRPDRGGAGPSGRTHRGKKIYDRRRDPGGMYVDDRRRGRKRGRKSSVSSGQPVTAPTKAEKRHIRIEETTTVGNLAHEMAVKGNEVIKKLFELGVMATINHTLDFETAELVAGEFGFTLENVAFNPEDLLNTPDADAEKITRSPVVTVMGHVDHGKTTLLDYIRNSRVASKEAGGITQHIGAYAVDVEGHGRVVFLDTPGHEAFTAMRARGAQVTDVIVLVVAADDGVMPQTIEAINHGRAAEVPIIVAINKIDKEGRDVERIRRELAEHNLVVEEWGGDVTAVEVSAKTGQGVDDLLETLALQNEIMELTAIADADARGVIIEARLERGRGAVATVLVQQGELSKGDFLVAGPVYGRVRAMTDHTGKQLKKAGPSTPVEVLGWQGVPAAGDECYVVESEKKAKQIVTHVADKKREKELAKSAKQSVEQLFREIEEGQTKELPIIVKADVHGSVEALRASLSDLRTDEVEVKVIHGGVGGVTESDINLAAASKATVLAFNVKAEAKGKRLADDLGVKVKQYTVIYDAIDDVIGWMEGLLEPEIEEEVIGHAEVRATFHVSKFGTIAGCYVTDGFIRRNARARIFRGEEKLWEGGIATLKRFKDDVGEVAASYECGMSFDGFNKLNVGDTVECFSFKEIKRKLDLEKTRRAGDGS